jgi:hypothetical protein
VSRWQRLVAWIDTREPVRALAVFRVAVAAVVLVTLGDMIGSGSLSALWLPPADGGFDALHDDHWLFAVIGAPDRVRVLALVGATLLGSVLIGLGLGARVAALVTGQLLLALFQLQPGTGGGHDRLITNAMWLLVLAPSDASWSLGCRLRTGRWVDDTPRVAWPRWLIAWQLTVTYTITGWQKLDDVWWPWGDLQAVYLSVLQPSWARWDLAWVAHVFPLTQAMTAVTLWWECTFGVVLIWLALRDRHPRVARMPVRGLYLALGVAVHGTLWATMNLGPFPFITLAFYAGLFRSADLEPLLPPAYSSSSSASSSPASSEASMGVSSATPALRRSR